VSIERLYQRFTKEETKFIHLYFGRIVETLFAKYGTPMVGSSRAVFVGINTVFKIPLNDQGVLDNHHEARMFERYGNENNLARSRMLKNTGVLAMTRVEHKRFTSTEAIPDWVHSVECMQVGHTRAGELVAYDYDDMR
jgi:hypothetical protein